MKDKNGNDIVVGGTVTYSASGVQNLRGKVVKLAPQEDGTNCLVVTNERDGGYSSPLASNTEVLPNE